VLKANMFLTNNQNELNNEIEISENVNENEVSDNEKNRHIFFLENLLTKLKNNQLSISEKQEISELYIKNMFINNNNEIDERNEKVYKYLYMGWYIYEFLINSDNINK
jgi:CCR4-NOT transcriptional regulation complex NOT5 subunit